MGLFGRNKSNGGGKLTVPDRLAAEARRKYDAQDFAGAFLTYAEAVDKLETIYAIANGQTRTPGNHDRQILEGIVSAAGAAKAMDADLDIRQPAEKVAYQLGQISIWAQKFKVNPSLNAVATAWLYDDPYDCAARNVVREAGA